MSFPKKVPCKCLNPKCGITFLSSNLVGGGGPNNLVIDMKTNCPRCGSVSKVADFGTDAEGKPFIQMNDFVKFLRKFEDIEKLKSLKSSLEEAGPEVAANGLALKLNGFDKGFEKFNNLILSLSKEDLKDFIKLILTILTLLISYYGLNELKENNDEVNRLEIEKFEYQKQRDVKNDELEKKRHLLEIQNNRIDIDKRINDLQQEFENKINSIKEIAPMDSVKKVNRTKVKGYKMYLKCPCGSGSRTADCHPYGLD